MRCKNASPWIAALTDIKAQKYPPLKGEVGTAHRGLLCCTPEITEESHGKTRRAITSPCGLLYGCLLYENDKFVSVTAGELCNGSCHAQLAIGVDKGFCFLQVPPEGQVMLSLPIDKIIIAEVGVFFV